MKAPELTRELKSKAKQLGFQLSGACAAVQPTGLHQFFDWLDEGYAGTMHYLSDRRAACALQRRLMARAGQPRQWVGQSDTQ